MNKVEYKNAVKYLENVIKDKNRGLIDASSAEQQLIAKLEASKIEDRRELILFCDKWKEIHGE